MRKQCVPGSFSSTHALEPGNEARYLAEVNKKIFFFQNQPGLLLVSGLGFALGLCLELKLLVIHRATIK